MALLEQINSMKQQGYSESQIATALKEQGHSATEINESLSQSKIKDAITGTSGMQPSTMPQAGQVQNYGQQYAAEAPQYAQQYQQQAQVQEQYPVETYNQEQYPQQYYPQTDVATIREVAKQEVETTLKDVKKELEVLSKAKTDLSYAVQSMDQRLKRIETVIQELQSAIIRKIGEYGEAISGISDEVKATQDSFSKIINPLLDKKRGLSSGEESEESYGEKAAEEKPKPKKGRGKGDSFEAYLGR